MGRLPISGPTRRAVGLLRLLALLLVIGATPALALEQPVEPVRPLTPAAKATAAHALDERAHRLAKDVSDGIVRVEPYLERYGYWAVFIAVGMEGIGIPAPGQTLLEAGAVVSATPGSELNVYVLLFVTILATSLGQTIGYLIGRTGERAILPRLPIPARSLEHVERLFNKYGGWLVVFGRFVDGPRQLIGLFSGVLAMHWGRFILLNLAGAVIWASFWTLGVYYLDLHLDAIVAALRHLNPWVAGLTLAGLFVLALALLTLLIRRGLRRQA
jgi:membrane protein DedA with SNARE-associated domain